MVIEKLPIFDSDSLGIYISLDGDKWFGPYESKREALKDHKLDASQEPKRQPWTISDLLLHIYGI
jgi:hypothetical protein